MRHVDWPMTYSQKSWPLFYSSVFSLHFGVRESRRDPDRRRPEHLRNQSSLFAAPFCECSHARQHELVEARFVTPPSLFAERGAV